MSSQNYSRDMAKLSLAKMLQTIGWNSINTTPLEILTDILVQYLLQISKTAHDYANEFGCTVPNLDHIGLAFRDCHVNLVELEEYVTFVDFAQPPIPVPKYPISKEDNLNFLKPGSKECLTRPVHIHEHLPSISLTEVENETEGTITVTVKAEEMLQDSSVKDMDSDNVLFKRPPEVSPSENFKRIKIPTSSETGAEVEQGRPTREISSVMMTTSGFISPAREGRLPDSRTPIVQAPISDPPSPEPPTGSPPLPMPPQSISVITVPQSQVGIPIIADGGDVTVQTFMDVVKQELQEYDDKGTVQQEPVQIVQPDRTPATVGMIPPAGVILGVTTPIMKKIKGPRKLDHHAKSRKEKLVLYHGHSQPHQNVVPVQPVVPIPSGTKSKNTSNQSNKDLVRQVKKHHQQVMEVQALVHSQIADMDQPMNLSTTAMQKSPHQNVDVTIHHAKVAKAKTNRTLAAARRKTEKLNTTITPVPMPASVKASGSGVDKLFNEPDKKKINIIKKISSVRNDGKPATLGKPVPAEDDGHMHPLLPNDVTIELVDIRNNQTQQGASGAGLNDLPCNPIPVKEKRKRKDRVAKPRKVPKLMPMTSPSPWDDIEVIERPKSPDLPHSHVFPKMAALGSGLPFPFLPQFSGPGLIPAFPNPLFPNHLLPHHAYAARAAALNSIIHHHNPYLADPHSTNDDNQPSTSSGQLYPMGQNVPGRPGRPRKTAGPTINRHQAFSSVAPVSDSAVSSQLKQGLVSSTTMSPQRSYAASPADESCNTAHPKHPPASQQVSSSSTTALASAPRSTPSSIREQSSSPNHAVVGSTVMLTPPLTDPVVVTPPAIASTSCTPAILTSTVTSGAAKAHSPLTPGSTKKHREHKKDKKDRIKKRNKKDRSKKDKVEKKKLREQLKIKLKKEKKERKKEKDMGRSNLSETLTIPKLTLKLGSPPPKSGQHDQSGTDSAAKLTVKPIILRKEENIAADDMEKKRESSPELARISPLVTGQPKPKFVQSVTSISGNQQNNEFSVGTKKFPVFKPIPRLAEIVTEEATSSAILPRTNTGSIESVTSNAPIPSQIPIPSKYIDSQGNEVWICPHCGKQDDGSPMIGCDDCDAWYHWVCVNMQVPPEENEDWYCKNCIKKRMQSSLLPEKKKKRKKKDRKEH